MDDTALALGVLLGRRPLFSSLSEEDFAELSAVLRRLRLRKGELIFRKGEPGRSMIIVGAGQLAVRVEEAEVGHLGPGEVIGEMSCIDPAPRSATVVAETDAHIFELDQAILHALRERAPQVVVAIVGGIITQLTARLRGTNHKLERTLRIPMRHRKRSAPSSASSSGGALAPLPYRGPLDLSPLRCERGLTERDVEVLLGVAPPVCFPDGALLCQEGTPGAACYILLRGSVAVLRRVGGVEQVLATLEPGAMVGQLALVDRGPRSASARALGEVVALPLLRDDFERLLKARSPLAIRFQEQVAIAGIRQLRMATEQLDS